MRDNDWYFRDDDQGLSEALNRRTEELYQIEDSLPDDDGYIYCPVLPLRDLIVYPRMVAPVFIGRDSTMLAVESAHSENQTVIALTQTDAEVENPALADFSQIGVEAAVGRLMSMPDGSRSALIQGRRRVELLDFVQIEPYLVARAVLIDEPAEPTREVDAMMRTATNLFERCVELNRNLPEEAYMYAMNIDQPGWLADMIASALAPTFDERLLLLETVDPIERLRTITHILAKEIDVLELEDEIHSRVQREVDRSQREVYLREQIKAIQSELGEGDLWAREIMNLRTRIEKSNLPDEPKERAFKEVERLGQMPPLSPEVGIIRTYLDWLLELPWLNATEDNLDLRRAKRVLDRHHYGLKRVKERILEHMAVMSLQPNLTRQPILCFVGPPGTGKTSLGKSIAETLGRSFVRLSLGGVRDEAEIRGHRRTYIGALPGRILQTMRRAGSINPLFMLDEVDKLGNDFRGDPSSALLEVLDPEQNNSFSDHYLELAYDLSQVMFITTANVMSYIPPPLLDRMEVIEFPGYIEDEKLQIAKKFLVPRQITETGLKRNEIKFQPEAIQRIIHDYTYEAGVRNLEREIGRILRKIARLKAEEKRYPSEITPPLVERYLGPPQFFQTLAEQEDEVGVATSIAWTAGGGDIMPVEVALMDGKGSFQITGQIGEVMQESTHAAMSYLKSKAVEYNLDPELFDKIDIHVHVPEGAIPKDGPSAGVTIATALYSALIKRKVKKDVGMTGEITLRGRVLPIGGVKEKVLAAHRAGLKTVILPRRNMKDLVEIPKRVKSDLNIVPVEHMDEILEEALVPERRRRPSTKGSGNMSTGKTQDSANYPSVSAN
ncbi:MAG: endopeptidase La [Anaerolineales bacterium]|nr:endopeptidase La [Anaerolineales bacterium]